MRMSNRTLAFPLVTLLLVAATGAIFSPGLSGGFIFDDFPNLVHEPAWKINQLNTEQLGQALHGGITGNGGRPLAILSFAFNHYHSGVDPFWLKLTSVLMHAFNGVLVFLLCRQLLQIVPTGPRPDRNFASLILASAWLLHPLQASTVLYVVQRMEIGAATGVLLALLAYIRARSCQMENRRAWPWLVAACMAMLFGLGFKESALLVPGFAFVIEACILRFAGSGQGRRVVGWILFYALGFTLAIAAYLVILLPWSDLVARYETRNFWPVERLMTQAPVLAMYLKQILLPLPDSMYFYYDNFPVSRTLWEARTLLSAVLLLVLAGVALASWRHWPLTSLGIGWFFVGHALTSNLIPLELAFEHRNYLALLGPLLAAVQPIYALTRRLHTDARVTMALVPVLAIAALCWVQTSTWSTPTRLAWALENRNPDSTRASYALGQQLLSTSNGDPSHVHWSLAKQQFLRTAHLPGESSLALQALIVMQARQGTFLDPELWHELRVALTAGRLTPERTSALHSVSQCRISGHCVLDDDQLLQTFLAVLQRNPHSATAHTLYADFAWNVVGDQTLATSMQHQALLLAPHSHRMRDNLAKFLLAAKEVDPAVRADAMESLHRLGSE